MRAAYPREDTTSLDGLVDLATKLGALVPSGLQSNGANTETDDRGGSHAEDDREPIVLPEGWLVPAPRGGKHYVGPASLLSFARDARRLVAKSKILQQPTYDEDGMRRYLQATEFTEYKVSHSLEANLEGHPATVAAASEAPRSVASEKSPDEIGLGFGASPGDVTCSVDRALSTKLINAYFDRIHHNFPILHRGAFQVRHEQTFGRSQARTDPGWMCTLCMVYTLGAQAIESELPGSRRLQEQYLSFIIPEGLGRISLSSTLSNIQALLLLALYQHNSGERNTAWTLTGHAVRTAVAAGLHRDGDNSHMDPFDKNIRRVVWWTLHLFEQYLSLALGRPSFTDAIVSCVEFPDESFEVGLGLPKDYLANCVSLATFIKAIKHTVALASICFTDDKKIMDLFPKVVAIHTALIAWKKGLPPNLGLGQRFSSPIHRRLVLNLLISADYLESILCRPFLLCRINGELEGRVPAEEINEIASHSISAAHASAIKVLVLDDYGLVEGTVWLDFYAIQHAIMITALHFLGQPTDPEGDSLREPVLRLLSVAQRTALAPTYRLTMKVALQLAGITRIITEPVPLRNIAPGHGDLNPDAQPSGQNNGQTGDDAYYDESGIAAHMPERLEADLFADFLSMGNDGYHANLFDNWNFFDWAEPSSFSFPEESSTAAPGDVFSTTVTQPLHDGEILSRSYKE